MQKFALVIVSLTTLLTVSSSPTHAGAVRISQFYYGGGLDVDSGSRFNADYVELFNASGSIVDLGGWVIAYDPYMRYDHSPPSPFTCSGCTGTIPAGTSIKPCSYLLVQLGPVGPVHAGPLPVAPDIYLDTPNPRFTDAGAIVLMSGGTPDGTCGTGPTEQDLLGWGESLARCWIGASIPTFSEAAAAVRLGDGMSDTGSNATDFYLTHNFTPHNASSPPNVMCLETPAVTGSWGRIKGIYR